MPGQPQKELVTRVLAKMGLADKWCVLHTRYDLPNFVRIERMTDGLRAGVAVTVRQTHGLDDDELTKRIRLAIATALRQDS
jgi:hypothetical protein